MLSAPIITRWAAAKATLARRLFIDRQAAFWARELGHRAGEARVLDVWSETADTKTFVLQPSGGWQRHRAGQYAPVSVEIDGVRLRRCYSISSAPSDPWLAITVKRLPGGRVSGWLHEHVRRGDRIGLDPAAGDFVLPDAAPQPLLLLSAGSGITPLMAMLREQATRGPLEDVVFVHYARSAAEVIFAPALQALAARHRGLRLIVGLSDDRVGCGRFDERRLAALVPDFAARATFVCGPAALMDRVDRMWQAAGAADRLQRERFVAPALLVPPASAPLGDGAVTIRLGAAAPAVTMRRTETLLDGLEAAGMRPAHGCRIGICHSCKQRKRSGTVQNLVTGALSSEADEDIQLCISAPCSDVELDLR